ncbi:glycerol-3-phosphate dehydrogenase/oxidase [Pelomonas sp. KK5]|uniref:glycerol-3-phosphate dehydrogenase/oxidase n=1 Tax=Pelomonas sp. KK5 TaxID=1855730 RepID=UPI00097CB035|nr:glycerol-3-phosphate dehydrogenase/oxidase [Pelomonas sp. KK5]
MSTPIDRAAQLARLRDTPQWDLVVIGGGATGLGVALDAAARGFAVALIEAEDFAKGTSSRATKLVHGGVRYLAQGNVSLVREALHERATLLANAPHLAQPLAFVMPARRWWEPAFYGLGLKLYDALAGSRGLGATQLLSVQKAKAALPNLNPAQLAGGVRYWDGQFDDARLAVTLARSAVSQGAAVLNHCPATGLLREKGRISGVTVRDAETGESFTLRSRAVVNATGVWVDAIRDMDREPGSPSRQPMVAPSQGVHVVVDRAFLPGENALIVPKTSDGRVLFAVPWLGKTLLGTTDAPRSDLPAEPRATEEEIGFILKEAADYLARAPRRQDVLSVWAGLRPLVKPDDDDAGSTKKISREHTVIVGRSGLVTVTGGKWTTYRAMAEDVMQRCFDAKLLPARGGKDATSELRLVGAPARAGGSLAQPPGEHLYGDEQAALRALPGAGRWLWRDGTGGFSEAMLRFAVRFEMARTVEDLLARRSRLLFLDAAKAEALARPVAALLAEELGRPVPEAEIQAFEALARRYRGLPEPDTNELKAA